MLHVPTLISNFSIDHDSLVRFILTVRKNYRNVPYHNWTHAFTVAHSMYIVIKNAVEIFTPIEVILRNYVENSKCDKGVIIQFVLIKISKIDQKM